MSDDKQAPDENKTPTAADLYKAARDKRASTPPARRPKRGEGEIRRLAEPGRQFARADVDHIDVLLNEAGFRPAAPPNLAVYQAHFDPRINQDLLPKDND